MNKDLYRIIFPNDQVISVESGKTILDAMIHAGLHADAPCGGHGVCGKCEVEMRMVGEKKWIKALACQTKVYTDLEVRLLNTDGRLRVLEQGSSAHGYEWNPWVRAIKLQLDIKTERYNSIWSHFTDALYKVTGLRCWSAGIRVINRMVELVRDKKLTPWVVVNGKQEVLDVFAEQPEMYMIAFDLGTTSIVGYLLDVNKQECLCSAGCINPQVQFGADVISRIDHALEHGGSVLTECVRAALNHVVDELCTTSNILMEQVYAVSLVGNTGMHHLFLNISPESLAKAPYNPAVEQEMHLKAENYGFNIHSNADLLVLPVIAGYVGADTVACLLSGNWTERQACTLLIDIGTNGELVLGNRERRLACSTAAGPAFEGAKIQCGMRGVDGAIDKVWLENGNIKWHVIGEGEALGLCGSGLVDLIAVLLASGLIDETGRFVQEDQYRLGDTQVVLTQKDVREVQLAKAAICAGIQIMAEHLEIKLEDIEEVHIAGAFGNYLNADSACATGLIPEVLREKIIKVGNAAGVGAKLVLQNNSNWEHARKLARETEFLELAGVREFQDVFVDALEFPCGEDGEGNDV